MVFGSGGSMFFLYRVSKYTYLCVDLLVPVNGICIKQYVLGEG